LYAIQNSRSIKKQAIPTEISGNGAINFYSQEGKNFQCNPFMAITRMGNLIGY
jgi:hypothetical protein